MVRTKQRNYTVEEFKTVISMWNDHTLEQMANAIGTHPSRINYIGKLVRKSGYDLPLKSGPKHSLKNLLAEIMAERGGK